MVLIIFLGNVAGSLQKTRSTFLRMVILSRSRFWCRHATLLPTNCEEERCVTTLKTAASETNSWLNFTRVYIEPNIPLVPLVPLIPEKKGSSSSVYPPLSFVLLFCFQLAFFMIVICEILVAQWNSTIPPLLYYNHFFVTRTAKTH